VFRTDQSFELARSSLIQKLRTKGQEMGMRVNTVPSKIHLHSATKF